MKKELSQKLMQIGFAALLARKKAVQKQYVYEKRGNLGGFTFEPILRGNTPQLADEEYMRKRYYSEMVFAGAQEGKLQTSIREGDPNKLAARRFWAGREGTGWNGTGKGGYMASLQPGVPETQGTGLGSAEVESDHLMQAYMNQQSKKMHILKGKSQQATADLFKRVTEQANRDSGVVDTSSKDYMPSAKTLGIPFNRFYEVYGKGERDVGNPFSANDKLKNKEWAKKAKARLKTYNFNWKSKDFFYTSYGSLQGQYAKKLAEMKPDKFTGEWYERLTASNLSSKYSDSGDSPPAAQTMFPDFETQDTFIDGTNMEHPGGQVLGPRSGRDPNQMEAPSVENFSGDGGTLNSGHMTVATPKLLRTVFKKDSIDQMFPEAWQVYKRDSRMDGETVFGGKSVQVRGPAEAKQFVRWMVKSANDELARMNEIIPTSFLQKNKWPTKMGGMEALGGDYSTAKSVSGRTYGGVYTDTHKFLGGLEGYGRGGQQGDWMGEIVQGFMSDFEVLNSEAKYKMANQFGPQGKDDWGWNNVETVKRGVDLYIPQSGGLLRIHLNVRIVAEGPNNRPYPEVYIPFFSKKYGTPDGIQFIKDVPMSYAEFATYADQSLEQMAEQTEVVKSFWRTGQLAQYMGQSMLTSNGVGARMFMGDMSPAQSVGFFTSTISVGDFAERLKTLVDVGAEAWWGEPDGFGGYFDLTNMEGGAFKEWALKWEQESTRLQEQINESITAKWKEWVSVYPKGGKTSFPPSLAKAWAAPVKLGPFVQSTNRWGRPATGRRPHGYYVQGDWEGGPLG